MSKIKQPRIEELVVRMAEAEAYFMGAHRVRNIKKLHSYNPALEILYYDHASGNTVVVVKQTRETGFACIVEVHPSNASAKRRYDELRKMLCVVDLNNLVQFVLIYHEWTLVRYYPSYPGRIASIKKHTSKVSWGNGIKDPNVDDFKELIANPYVLEDEDLEREMKRLFEADAPPAEDDDVVELDGQEDDTDDKTGEQHPENQGAVIPSGPSPALPGMEEQTKSKFLVVYQKNPGRPEVNFPEPQIIWADDFEAAAKSTICGSFALKAKELPRQPRPWRTFVIGHDKDVVSVAMVDSFEGIICKAGHISEMLALMEG